MPHSHRNASMQTIYIKTAYGRSSLWHACVQNYDAAGGNRGGWFFPGASVGPWSFLDASKGSENDDDDDFDEFDDED